MIRNLLSHQQQWLKSRLKDLNKLGKKGFPVVAHYHKLVRLRSQDIGNPDLIGMIVEHTLGETLFDKDTSIDKLKNLKPNRETLDSLQRVQELMMKKENKKIAFMNLQFLLRSDGSVRIHDPRIIEDYREGQIMNMNAISEVGRIMNKIIELLHPNSVTHEQGVDAI